MRWAHLPEFDFLPSEWELVSLTEVADVIAGQSPPSETYNDKGNGLPFLQGNADFGEYHPEPIIWCEKPNRVCLPGSTLISVRAPVGELNRADQEYAIGRGLAAIQVRDIDPDYLHYGMLRWARTLIRAGQGTTYDAVTSRHFRQIKIPRPKNENEQKAIAKIIKAVDESIVRTREELEAARRLKTTLMQQLFTRGIPGKHQRFLKTKWLHFPTSWDVQKLGALAKIKSGFTMGRDLSRHECIAVPYVTVINVQEGYFELSNISTAHIKKSELENVSLCSGDILMTEGGDRDKLGRGAIWTGEIEPCSYQNHIFRIRFNNDLYKPKLLHFYLQSWQAKNYFYAHAKQTNNLCTINSRELKKFPIAIPDPQEQEKMLGVLESSEHLLQTLEDKVEKQKMLKKSLLQNLLTGKMRVNAGAQA